MKYTEDKLHKAMNMTFRKEGFEYYVKADGDKDCYEYKIKVNNITNMPICNCWWYVNRAQRYSNKYGMCSHQLGWLFQFNKKVFWSEVTNDGN